MRSVASRLMHGLPKKPRGGGGKPLHTALPFPAPPQEAVNGQRAGAGLQGRAGRQAGSSPKGSHLRALFLEVWKTLNLSAPLTQFRSALSVGYWGKVQDFKTHWRLGKFENWENYLSAEFLTFFAFWGRGGGSNLFSRVNRQVVSCADIRGVDGGAPFERLAGMLSVLSARCDGRQWPGSSQVEPGAAGGVSRLAGLAQRLAAVSQRASPAQPSAAHRSPAQPKSIRFLLTRSAPTLAESLKWPPRLVSPRGAVQGGRLLASRAGTTARQTTPSENGK